MDLDDDDVFFADLSKQIALLITEDDEDDVQRMKFPQQYLPVPVQGYYAHFPQIMTPPFYAYEHTCIRESRGTGVFIPKSSPPRRKPKQPKPHSAAAIHQTKQFSITAAGVSDISAGADHAGLSNRGNSGPMKDLHVYRTG
ncbi:hypothetical protein KSP40_PGU017664 [Platanthera guangdongensis]|uniref:Uncharacterized protein n=1 Tax=Platanthera guangdongensis TaxID=2320717 RepID=A0ABR2M7J0_9ASPA